MRGLMTVLENPGATHTRFVGRGPDDTRVQIFVPDNYLYGNNDAVSEGVFIGTKGGTYVEAEIAGQTEGLKLRRGQTTSQSTLSYANPETGETGVIAFSATADPYGGPVPTISGNLIKAGAEPEKLGMTGGPGTDAIEVSNLAVGGRPTRMTELLVQLSNGGPWLLVTSNLAGENVRAYTSNSFDGNQGDFHAVQGDVQVLGVKGAHGLQFGGHMFSGRSEFSDATPVWDGNPVVAEIRGADLAGFSVEETGTAARVSLVAARELGAAGPKVADGSTGIA